MAQHSISQTQHSSSGLYQPRLWKQLWRGDAVLTLLMADALLFAGETLRKGLGMEASALPYLRAAGLAFILYALWQLWAARSGRISALSFQLAALDMGLMGLAAVGVVALGVPMNALAQGLILGLLGLGGFILAGLWLLGARAEA